MRDYLIIGLALLGLVTLVRTATSLTMQTEYGEPYDWRSNYLVQRLYPEAAIPGQVKEDILAYYDSVDSVTVTTLAECEYPYNDAYQCVAQRNGQTHYGVYCMRQRANNIPQTYYWIPQSIGTMAEVYPE